MSTTDSYFDGGLLGQVCVGLISIIITTITLGLALPWAVCYRQDWLTKHTVVEGKRLRFDGTAAGLFGTWIKIWLLSIITLGIYGFWASLAVKKWVTSHTRFAAV